MIPFRQLMLADPDHILFDIDLDQAENRIVAYIAPEPRMISAFENNIDIHSLTASLIFKKSISQVSAASGSCQLGAGRDSERDWGKKANHSLNYGLGYKEFSLRYELPETEGKLLVENYHFAYPGIRGSYYNWIQALLKDRVITNCFGRRRYFQDVTLERAYAFIPQSTVADKINMQGLLYIWNNQDIFEPVDILMQVHDSIVFEVRIETGWTKIAYLLLSLRKSLETPIDWHNRSFVIPASIKMGFNLSSLQSIKLPSDIDNAAAIIEQEYKKIAA